jgi:hypothetical protein
MQLHAMQVARDEEARVSQLMRYITSILVENNNHVRLRAHISERSARAYVHLLAVRLSRLCDAERTRMFLSQADVYSIQRSGVLRHVAHFNGQDRGDGFWYGWDE